PIVNKIAIDNVATIHFEFRARDSTGLRNPAVCAARSKQRVAMIEKSRSTRFDGMIDINKSPPMLQQISQSVSGEISRNALRKLQRRAGRCTPDNPIRTAF